MDTQKLREQLKSLNELSKALMHCQNLQEASCRALEEIRARLNVQVASIFLISKDGVLKRIGIKGVDTSGNNIHQSWFSDEQYKPGESFSGKAIPPFDADSGYGEPQYSNSIVEDYSMVNELIYTRAFGELRCGISVPLNGAYRSFGTLEVLNKGNKERFSSEDVYWLSMISASLSNCISFFRMEEHLSVYKQLIDILVSLEAPSQNFDLEELCELVAKILTKDFTPYKVCIVRLADNKDDLEIKIRAKTHTSDISWEERKDGSIKSGSKIAGEAYLTKMPKYVEDINNSEVENFINKAWIRKNNLRSFACLPLSIKDECVGTISVYAQYSQKFYENHKSFLENISFLTTSIIARARNIQDLRRIRKERNIIREKLLNSSLLISYDNLSRANLHQYKNELINFGQILSKIARSSHISSKTKDFIDEQQGWIHQRITALGDEMTSESEDPIPTDLNNAVEEVLESFSFEFSDIQIYVRKMFDDNIPALDIDERKVKDIIFNLLTNAERSIQRAGRARGEIMIQTAIDRSQKIANVQFSVEDNGEGIKKEIREKIFDKGFTTGKDAGGTGVGLFVVREILNSYGGKIKVESIFGKGAKFLVEIPLERYRLH